MKVVVTGATGNVGTALLRLLAAEPGWQVTGVARHRPDSSASPYDTADWISCDLGAPSAVGTLAEACADAAVVVHLAWAIDPHRDEPPMARTNLLGSRHVLAAAERARVPHLVCASSIAAYSPAPRWHRLDESWPCDGNPKSAYSREKAELEGVLDEFEATHPAIRLARIRPCAIVQRGAGGQFARWTTSPLFPTRLIGRRWLPVPWWRGLRAQAVHADDVAVAVRAIMLGGHTGAFNLAAEPVLAGAELARLVGGGPRLPMPRAVGRAVALATWRIGLQPLHPGWLTLADEAPLVDTTRARRELAWTPAHDTRQALGELLAGLGDGSVEGSEPLKARGGSLRERLRAITLGRPSRQSQS